MDIEKALLDQNLVLGRIEAGLGSVQSLQMAANGRTGKLEDRVTSLETGANKRLVDLETAKKVADGQLAVVKWVGSVLIVLVGIVEPVILHYWK